MPFSASNLAWSMSFLRFFIFVIKSFSVCHLVLIAFSFSFKSESCLEIAFNLLLTPFSFLIPSLSISNFLISFLQFSSSRGSDSISNFKADIASSIKSTALSGKNLSVIYLAAKCTQETKTLSFIFTP